jgi:hypothetical protein
VRAICNVDNTATHTEDVPEQIDVVEPVDKTKSYVVDVHSTPVEVHARVTFQVPGSSPHTITAEDKCDPEDTSYSYELEGETVNAPTRKVVKTASLGLRLESALYETGQTITRRIQSQVLEMTKKERAAKAKADGKAAEARGDQPAAAEAYIHALLVDRDSMDGDPWVERELGFSAGVAAFLLELNDDYSK